MDSLLQDVRYAFRTLARSPGFAIAAVLLLGMGIGANTALFSVLEEAVLAEPPYPEPEEIVVVDILFGRTEADMRPNLWSYPRFQAFREEVESVENPAGYGLRTMTLTELGDPAVVAVESVSPSYFSLLGVEAVAGRVFSPDEVDGGSADLVGLVSHSFWRTRMGASPDAVGGSITLDRVRLNILGVLPPGFDGITGAAEVWIPLSALRVFGDATFLEDPWNHHFNVLGRLSASTTFESTRAEVQGFGATFMERYPPPPAASELLVGSDLVRFREARVNPVAEASMFTLFAAVVLVLLVATANLAGLSLARGASRQHETAIRGSLGAGRVRILRQLLTESLTLAFLGGLLGVGAAWIGVDLLGSWLADTVGSAGGRSLEYIDPEGLSVDWRVLTFAIVLTGGVGILFGILPAWQAARTNPGETLKSGGGGEQGRAAFGLPGRSGLVIVQVGVALVLLAGATLMMRGLGKLQDVRLGFEPAGLLTAMYSLTPADEEAGINPASFHVDFLERVRALPGVVEATLGEVPMGGPTKRTIVMGSDGRPDLTPAVHAWIRLQPVPGGHLGTLGATMISGRDIADSDDAESQKVVVLNRTAAEYLFPDGDPVGRKILLPWPGFMDDGTLVVGVVEDIQFAEPGAPAERQGFTSIRQTRFLDSGLMVRASGDPIDLVPAIRSTLAELNPNIALTSVMTMQERAAETTARPRVISLLLSIFAAFALFLVAAGLYGSIAFAVVRRTHELGVRASLGADRGALLGLVLKRGLTVTVLGVAVGVIGAFWATGFLGGLMVGVERIDAVTLAGAAGVLLLVALVAAYLPARRAMDIDPMAALRRD